MNILNFYIFIVTATYCLKINQNTKPLPSLTIAVDNVRHFFKENFQNQINIEFQKFTDEMDGLERLSDFKHSSKQKHKHQIEQLTHEKFKNLTGSNWLSAVNQSKSVSQLSIPGTHDSASYDSPEWYNSLINIFWKTQKLDIQQQFRIGVRFLDLRIKCQSGEGLTLFHGPIYLGDINKVLEKISNFLKENPTQFVLMMFQKQAGDDSSKICGGKLLSSLSYEKIKYYCYACYKKIPKVKDLRGRVWIIEANPGYNQNINIGQAFKIPTYNKKQIALSPMCYIQNLWEGPFEQKIIKINEVINKPKNYMRINFLTESQIPSQYAQIYNNWFKSYMNAKQLKEIGVIIFDFVTDELANLVYSSNL